YVVPGIMGADIAVNGKISMSSDKQPGKRVVILGGGTAGWITANAMIDSWSENGIDITLIESPAIGTVGVGEGSTPRMKLFFDSIGVQESEWMPRCNATYKNGISFANWSTRPGFNRYFHPFASQLDQHTITAFYFNTYARRQGIGVHAHPDRFFLAAKLSENRQSPKPNENFPFVVEYGYHFDANLVGDFLKERARENGVKHIAAKVVDVNQASNGDIASLLTDTGEIIEGDFFVDCSGFRGTLIQETLDVPFQSFAENLFNDSAVVLPTEQHDRIGSQTVSTALKHGWAWEIPLTHRIGNGYVYSSSFCSSDDAETELRTHLGLLNSDTEARHLKMKVGQVEKHWHRNCLAIGLSQGFIEPLEATALNLVCNTVYDFIETVDADGFAGTGREGFNERTSGRFERIRDYIVAHYIMNSRNDTDYWRQNGENRRVSESLRQILQIWKSGKSLSQEMERLEIRSSYTAMSWNCLLSGYGFYPEIRPMPADNPAINKINMGEIDEFIRRCSLNFQSQDDALRFR
ncbi:MAG: tryptophan halogenase family protein, partial [Woeseiaceae bacterium]